MELHSVYKSVVCFIHIFEIQSFCYRYLSFVPLSSISEY